MIARTRAGTAFLLLLAAAIVALSSQQAYALIEGGAGNAPLRDPGWPQGAAAIINTPSRIAFWVGPLGGHWHADCRGDAKALSAVLADFAKLDVKNKQVVLHDGVGHSRWLSGNNDPKRRAAAQMDWMFTTWEKNDWKRQRKFQAEKGAANAKDADSESPAQLDVYTGGNVTWDDVKVPKGLKIVDLRLESHGFTLADSVVLEGKVTDLATKKPLAALVRLQRIEPQPKGAHRYTTIAEVVADAAGHWVFKKAPAGWLSVTVEADGYVPRVAGHDDFNDQPKWQVYDCGLSRGASVSGRITDNAGQPIAEVEVRIESVTIDGRHYPSALGNSVKTGQDGRFRMDQTPLGRATISAHKPGYLHANLSQPITPPKNDVELKMTKAASVEVTVDFTGKERPEEYLVRIEPEDGPKIGSWGGTGQINAKNQVAFQGVPAGRYVVSGRPNPGADNQQTEPVTIELKSGQSAKVTLNAK